IAGYVPPLTERLHHVNLPSVRRVASCLDLSQVTRRHDEPLGRSQGLPQRRVAAPLRHILALPDDASSATPANQDVPRINSRAVDLPSVVSLPHVFGRDYAGVLRLAKIHVDSISGPAPTPRIAVYPCGVAGDGGNRLHPLSFVMLRRVERQLFGPVVASPVPVAKLVNQHLSLRERELHTPSSQPLTNATYRLRRCVLCHVERHRACAIRLRLCVRPPQSLQ